MYNARTGQTMELVPGSQWAKYAGGGARNQRPMPMPQQQQPQMGVADITSGFRPPRPPYANTETDVSQAVADIFMENNPQWLRKQYSPAANSGVSASASTEAQIAPRLAAANVQSRMAQSMIPYQNALGNAQYNLGNQAARSQDVLGQANNLFSRQQMQDNFDLDTSMAQYGLLGQLMQMLGGIGGGLSRNYIG
jgi:hypothetical protein